MAAYSPPGGELDSRQQAPDSKAVKKTIARAGKALRALLTNHEDRLEALVRQGLLKDKNTKDVVKDLQENVGKNPSLLNVLLREISCFPEGTEAAVRLQVSNPGQKGQTTAVLGKLKRTLSGMKNMKPRDEVIKTTIVEAIIKELKYPHNIESIKFELFRMKNEGVMSQTICEWAIAKAHMLAAEKVDDNAEVRQYTPIKLSNDDLYHACLCSAIANSTCNNMAECKSLFQSLSHKLLNKIAFTQSECPLEFPSCLVAVSSSTSENKTSTTCYIAFQDLKIQGDVYTEASTLGNALQHQLKTFPILFVESVVKRFDRLVLTGFSFGGVLAQMLAGQLWLLPQTNTEQLMSSVICITFGQPLIHSNLLRNVVEIYPDFRNNVHAICSSNDNFPLLIETLDPLISANKDQLPTILENLVCLQELCGRQNQSSDSGTHADSAELASVLPSIQYCKAPKENQSLPSTSTERESLVSSRDILGKLEKVLQSQQTDPSTVPGNSTAKRHLIECTKSGVKLVEMSKSLQCKMKTDLISQDSFDQHSTDAYFKSVKEMSYDHEGPAINNPLPDISCDFLCPSIDQVKITHYGLNDAIVVVTGQQLWFVYSIKLSEVIGDPFQVQERSVSFKTSMDNLGFVIQRSKEESEVVVYSHFHMPIQRKLIIELNLNTLSPRGKQLALLEPGRLLEFGLMISLLERCPKRLNCSKTPTVQLGETPSSYLGYFKQLLYTIAAVVPYESILCTVARCHDVSTICERYVHIIQELDIDFPFSLMMYASLFVAVFKIQHHTSIFSDEQAFEDCAQFMWLKAKYTKDVSSKVAVDSFSDEVFTDTFVFGSPEHFCDDALYLRKLVQKSLIKVNSLSEVEATSNLSAADLYRLKDEGASPGTKHKSKGLKSPISVLLKGRDALEQANDISKPHLYEEIVSKYGSYEETMQVLHKARGVHFDFCIRVLCDFMYQHVQVPFTETNPMTNWKCFCHQIAPYSDILKNDSEFWSSLIMRCQRAISKGSQVAEGSYSDKLKFLVTNIDPESNSHTAPSSSLYSLEKKLKEVCSDRKIEKEISVDRMVHEWQSFFQNCPMADVARSHRSLICRWIKWSLLIHELRVTLENQVTIAVTGLVNSGKTQLIQSLFGFQVMAGTIESRRTIIPFMYSLAPEVGCVHVVDLPGADDSDRNVLQLTEFLKSISQVVVFVVHYKKAHTKDALKWLDIFEKRRQICDEHDNPSIALQNEESSVPVLVCMTFADRLLAELMDDNGKYDVARARIQVAKNFEEISTNCYQQAMWKQNGKRTVGCYSLDLSCSSLCEHDMKAVNIGVPSDVGVWLCKQLREELHACEVANQLESYFKRSCCKL